MSSRFLGVANGGRSLNLVGGSGIGRVALANCRTAGFDGAAVESSTSTELPNYHGGGAFLIYNVADTLFVSDLNSKEKVLNCLMHSVFWLLFLCVSYYSLCQDPIKAIQFSNSSPVCHAFDAEANDGHDLLIGLQCGDGWFGQL